MIFKLKKISSSSEKMCFYVVWPCVIASMRIRSNKYRIDVIWLHWWLICIRRNKYLILLQFHHIFKKFESFNYNYTEWHRQLDVKAALYVLRLLSVHILCFWVCEWVFISCLCVYLKLVDEFKLFYWSCLVKAWKCLHRNSSSLIQ